VKDSVSLFHDLSATASNLFVLPSFVRHCYKKDAVYISLDPTTATLPRTALLPSAALLRAMCMGKPVRAHQPKRVNNHEWAHDRPMASAANSNKWAHYISVNGPMTGAANTNKPNGPIIFLSIIVNGPMTDLWQVLLIQINGPI
jgi:hypothetical protein